MEKIKQALTSKTVWTIVALVVINGLPSVREMLPASIVPFLDIVLGLAATYFKVTPSQQYGTQA